MSKLAGWAAAAALLAVSGTGLGARKPVPAASKSVKTQEVDYKQGETALQGTLAWNEAAKGKRPGLLVVHEWWGHNEHARRQARRLAEAGYVAFALDMYGKGKVATHPKDAQAFMAEVQKDPALEKARFDAALELLRKDPRVDPEKLGAVGYCFGGGVVLSMVRAGADLDAVGIFHAPLAAETPAKKGAVKPRILVMTGAADAYVPAEQVEAFKKEMSEAGARAEVISYPGAKHSFTNPDSDKLGIPELGYNAEADRKSFAALLRMLKEVFGT